MIFGQMVIAFTKLTTVLHGAAFNRDGDAHKVPIRDATVDGSTDCNKHGDEDNSSIKLNISGGDKEDNKYGEDKIAFAIDTFMGVEGEDGVGFIAHNEAISDGNRPQYDDLLKFDAYLE